MSRRPPARARVREAVSGVMVLGVAIALAGCSGADTASPSSGPPPSPSASSSSRAQRLERPDPMVEAQQGAAQAGAGPEQIAVLADGVVTYDEYEQSLERAFACMRDAGSTVNVSAPKQLNGVTVLPFTFSAADDAQRDAADACFLRHAEFVDTYWQVGSPDAVAFEERRSAALLPALRECLDEHGVDWAEDETFEDLVSKSVTKPSDPVQFNCMAEIGYMKWSG